MKKMLWLLLVPLLLWGCAGEEAVNPYRLKTQEHTSFYEGDSDKWSSTYFYDEQGRVSRIEQDDGTCAFHTYDAYGNLIRTEIQGSDGTDVVSEYILTLDEKHRPVRSEYYWNGERSSTTVSSYDKYGNAYQLDIDRVLPNGNVQSQVIRDYDREGNLLREETTWSNGNSSHQEYHYKKGRLTYHAEYDGEGALQRYSEYTWDEATRTETRNLYRYDGVADGKVVITYDEYDNPLTMEYYHGPYSAIGGGDDRVDRIVTYTYERIP